MLKRNILFIKGTSDNKNVQILEIRKDGSAVLEHPGSIDIYSHIQSALFNKTLLTFDTNPRQEIMRISFDAVFNQVSDPDTQKTALLKVEGMHRGLPPQIPFFNTPSNIRKTTRDNIYQLLQGINKLHVPKTVKIQPKSPSDIYDAIDKEDFDFPVIFRQAGDHGGVSTVLVENKDEQFHAFPLDGRDYYLTQFINYAENGMYKKYRLIVIDGKVFLHHVLFSKNWMIHDKTQLQKTRADETTISKRFSREIKPSIQSIITEIHHRLGLDYFGIDCHIDEDMNLLAFKINVNMNIFIDTENSVFKKHIERARQALIKMLTK